MGRNVAILLTTVVCFCTAAASAHAHHSHGLFYDQCTTLTIDGKIEAVQWKNPHTLIDLKTTDGATFRAEWIGLQGVANSGIAGPAQDALKVGERIVVTANPMRDAAAIRVGFPAYKEPAEKMKVVDVTQIRHASDSWNWASTPPEPRGCAQK